MTARENSSGGAGAKGAGSRGADRSGGPMGEVSVPIPYRPGTRQQTLPP